MTPRVAVLDYEMSNLRSAVKALERLGIRPTVTSVDPAQYRERTDAFDFDMTTYARGLSLSPDQQAGPGGR